MTNFGMLTIRIQRMEEWKMKRFSLLSALICLTGLIFAGTALAAGTATVNVSATVLGTCSFDTTSYTMNFGSINTTDTGAKTATATLAFTCSNGTPWTLDDVSAVSHNLTGGVTGSSLAYSIGAYTTSGTGTGATQNVTLTGTIAQAAYSVAAADAYTDSLTININP